MIATWLAQLGEQRSAEREVAGSTLDGPGSGTLNNWEESAALVMTSAKRLDFLVFLDKDEKL